MPLRGTASCRIGLLRTANHSTSTESASPWAGHGVPEGVELLAYLLALTRRC